jgi:hypothetical protein
MLAEEIKNHLINVKKLDIQRFFNKVEDLDYTNFVNNLNDKKFVIETINKIVSGHIYILRSSVSKNFFIDAKIKLQNIYENTNPISPKMLNGIKNGYYISENSTDVGYQTMDRSFYFFSWNNDESGIYNNLIEKYKPLKILNGFDKNEVTSNIPTDGFVERLHAIHYPVGGGKISKHYDSTKLCIANFGVYGTEFGIDYNHGGFFLENKKKEKINIDPLVKTGDLVIFHPGLIHGVDPILPKKKLLINSQDGRWFFNMNVVESHEVKNRDYSVSVK